MTSHNQQNQQDQQDPHIKAGWEALIEKYPQLPSPNQGNNDGQISEDKVTADPSTAGQSSEKSEDQTASTFQTEQQKIDITTTVIEKGLRIAFDNLLELEIKDELYRQTAEAYAVLLIHYFPDLTIFEILEKYKRELTALWMTILFTKAATQQLRQKKLKAATGNQSDNTSTNDTGNVPPGPSNNQSQNQA